MPLTSRASVKASFLYLALGAVVGAILLINRWVPLGPAVSALRATHVQFLILGWLTQLIVGVAWWLLPPLPIGLQKDAPLPIRRGQAQRGSERLFWTALTSLNAGILLRALSEPLSSWTDIDAFSILTIVSGLFLLAAAVLFVTSLWSRVRELGQD